MRGALHGSCAHTGAKSSLPSLFFVSGLGFRVCCLNCLILDSSGSRRFLLTSPGVCTAEPVYGAGALSTHFHYIILVHCATIYVSACAVVAATVAAAAAAAAAAPGAATVAAGFGGAATVSAAATFFAAAHFGGSFISRGAPGFMRKGAAVR